MERKQQTALCGQRSAHAFAVMEATLMKGLSVISTAALFLLLGATLPAFAQEEHQDAKPEKQEQKAKPAKQKAAKPAKQDAQSKPAKQEEQAKAKPAQHEEQAKPAKQEEQAKTEKHQSEAKPVKQEERGKSGGQQHAQRTAVEEQRQRSVPALRLSARGSGRIPDDRFRANFGQEHVFVISEPVMVGGFSRFQYGGFYFGFVDPWPDGWYYTDDVYVDYIDGGYYLYNPYYPGVRVSISVVL